MIRGGFLNEKYVKKILLQTAITLVNSKIYMKKSHIIDISVRIGTQA